MLGYIKTDSRELRLREYEYYRALYCGLCKRMGKCTGNCSRMTLSYDFVFLAAVRLAITGEKPVMQKGRCLLHPFRKRMMAKGNDALDYAADASAILCYHKLTDDLHDEKGLKKLGAVLSRPFLTKGYRRAKKRHPALDAAVREHLLTLSRYESGEIPVEGADPLAAEFGKIMEAVFSQGLEGWDAKIACNIGRAVGHWIYLADAADDLAQDRKKGRFNPYLDLFEDPPTKAELEHLEIAMTSLLCQAENALQLVDSYPSAELKEIIWNILYLGMPATAKAVIGNADGSDSRKNEKKGNTVHEKSL